MNYCEIRKFGQKFNRCQQLNYENGLSKRFSIARIEIYELNESQLNAVNEAREQLKTGKYLTSEKADKEIDEWLNK